ncbi:uncharacterized protein LOC122808811 [Protopterus annectens]|uniref:uncharacterized protein LOC122808811 n=1 Tax=Protopterus annectens TaxID=7888 RepID=UPI001CFB9556|nr:uncharacterized protein LOC122808811 [Protopterus annectens]XP_043935807.1 uncharacterized protein LOC122808811 [Protopterus annectens]
MEQPESQGPPVTEDIPEHTHNSCLEEQDLWPLTCLEQDVDHLSPEQSDCCNAADEEKLICENGAADNNPQMVVGSQHPTKGLQSGHDIGSETDRTEDPSGVGSHSCEHEDIFDNNENTDPQLLATLEGAAIHQNAEISNTFICTGEQKDMLEFNDVGEQDLYSVLPNNTIPNELDIVKEDCSCTADVSLVTSESIETHEDSHPSLEPMDSGFTDIEKCDDCPVEMHVLELLPAADIPELSSDSSTPFLSESSAITEEQVSLAFNAQEADTDDCIKSMDDFPTCVQNNEISSLAIIDADGSCPEGPLVSTDDVVMPADSSDILESLDPIPGNIIKDTCDPSFITGQESELPRILCEEPATTDISDLPFVGLDVRTKSNEVPEPLATVSSENDIDLPDSQFPVFWEKELITLEATEELSDNKTLSCVSETLEDTRSPVHLAMDSENTMQDKCDRTSSTVQHTNSSTIISPEELSSNMDVPLSLAAQDVSTEISHSPDSTELISTDNRHDALDQPTKDELLIDLSTSADAPEELATTENSMPSSSDQSVTTQSTIVTDMEFVPTGLEKENSEYAYTNFILAPSADPQECSKSMLEFSLPPDERSNVLPPLLCEKISNEEGTFSTSDSLILTIAGSSSSGEIPLTTTQEKNDEPHPENVTAGITCTESIIGDNDMLLQDDHQQLTSTDSEVDTSKVTNGMHIVDNLLENISSDSQGLPVSTMHMVSADSCHEVEVSGTVTYSVMEPHITQAVHSTTTDSTMDILDSNHSEGNVLVQNLDVDDISKCESSFLTHCTDKTIQETPFTQNNEPTPSEYMEITSIPSIDIMRENLTYDFNNFNLEEIDHPEMATVTVPVILPVPEEILAESEKYTDEGQASLLPEIAKSDLQHPSVSKRSNSCPLNVGITKESTENRPYHEESVLLVPSNDCLSTAISNDSTTTSAELKPLICNVRCRTQSSPVCFVRRGSMRQTKQSKGNEEQTLLAYTNPVGDDTSFANNYKKIQHYTLKWPVDPDMASSLLQASEVVQNNRLGSLFRQNAMTDEAMGCSQSVVFAHTQEHGSQKVTQVTDVSNEITHQDKMVAHTKELTEQGNVLEKLKASLLNSKQQTEPRQILTLKTHKALEKASNWLASRLEFNQVPHQPVSESNEGPKTGSVNIKEWHRKGIKRPSAQTCSFEENMEDENDNEEEDVKGKSLGTVELKLNMPSPSGVRRRKSKLVNSSIILYQEYSEVSLTREIQRQQRGDTFLDVNEPPSPRPRRKQLSTHDSFLHRLSVCNVVNLWQDIPDVRQSGALSSMTSEEQKLQEAKFELIVSEASYLRSLNIAVDHFQRSSELNAILTPQDKQWLFSRMQEVRDVSTSFLADLEDNLEDDILHFSVCEVILKHCPDFRKVYLPYVTNQSYQEQTYKRLSDNNPRFQHVLEKLESDAICQRLSLKSFLILPFQRITRMKLLVQNILKRTRQSSKEEKEASEAYDALEKLIRDCNESVRKMKSTEELIHLNQKIEFECKIFPLISQSRWLVKHGELTELEYSWSFSMKAKQSTRPIYLHLFSDWLLLSRKKEGGRFVVFDHCRSSKVKVEKCEVKLHGPQKNLLRIFLEENNQGKTAEFLLRAQKQSEKLRWISALTFPKKQLTFAEYQDKPQVQCLKAYKAQENDELNLEKADVLMVIERSKDGWMEGIRLSDGERGWFPSNHVDNITNTKVRQRNLMEMERITAATAKLGKK